MFALETEIIFFKICNQRQNFVLQTWQTCW